MEPLEMGTGTHGVRTGTPRGGDSTSRAGMRIRVGVEPLECRYEVQGKDRILWSWDRDLQQGDVAPRDGDRHPWVGMRIFQGGNGTSMLGTRTLRGTGTLE